MKKKYSFEVRIRLRSFNVPSLEILKQKLKKFADSREMDCLSINLPVKKKKITVLKSPHVNKKAREQFELCSYKRLLDIYSSSSKTVDALMRLELPSGVDVEIKV